ncbi:Glucan endo-1,3-beta-D-glucosidase [Bertholletia excelsa]
MVSAIAVVCSFIVALVSIANVAEGGIGVNWGNISSHILPPDIVVQMLKDNGIKKVKLFNADPQRLKALSGTDIQIMVTVPNGLLKSFANSYDYTKKWVNQNITSFVKDKGADVRWVSVGNEPFLTAYKDEFTNDTLPAIKNVQKALNEAGLGDKIKATSAINADVLWPGAGPSGSDFRPDMKDLMYEMVRYYKSNKSPFVCNIYPFFNVYQNPNFPLDYAFFDGKAQPNNDNGNLYYNVYDATVDVLVYSIRKAGVGDIEVIIGEIGWPTDGDIHATVALAKRFYDGFLPKMASQKGTPAYHGDMDVFLFELLDEDAKSVLPGNFEPHWGIFRADGRPKFKIDFSGKNGDGPVAAKGVEYLGSNWCVLNPNAKDLSRLAVTVEWACNNTDCTSLGYGCSCGNLDSAGNASYAFNSYFQSNDQNPSACNFDGLGTIVTKDPSTSTCDFPVQINLKKTSGDSSGSDSSLIKYDGNNKRRQVTCPQKEDDTAEHACM